MKLIKLHYKLFFFILTFWFLLNFNFKLETILFGILIAFIVTLASHQVLYDENGFRYKGVYLSRMIFYVFILFTEIFKSAFLYIANLISKKYEPVVFKIELNLLDPVQVGIVANSITLTPGTITVDIIDHTILVMMLAKPGTSQEELERPIRMKFEKLLKQKEPKQ
ncbi:MAG: Na+/H+ antiporter subunit E [Acholeplasmataceae bacterium]|nr:Na+/H+ antiporter subunit E [Acholeplasmataceae bacterium]